MALGLTRRVNETVVISLGDARVFVWVSQIKAHAVRLCVEAPAEVKVDRQEVAEANGEQSIPEGWTHERPVR